MNNILPDNAHEITQSFLSQFNQNDNDNTYKASETSLQDNNRQNVNDVEDAKKSLSNLVNDHDIGSKTMAEWLNKDNLIVHPVWIGNITRGTTVNQLRHFVESKIGRALVSIHITNNNNERGYAFLNLPTAEKQLLAVTFLDGQILAENKLIVKPKRPSKFRQSLFGNSPISQQFKHFRDNIVPKILANPNVNLNVTSIRKILEENNINVDDLPIRVWGVQCTLNPNCHRQYCSFYHSHPEKELGRIISVLTAQNSDNASNNKHQQALAGTNNPNAMKSKHTLLLQGLPRSVTTSKQIEEIFDVFGDIDNIIVNPDHTCYLRMKRWQDAKKIVHLNKHNYSGVTIDFAPYGAVNRRTNINQQSPPKTHQSPSKINQSQSMHRNTGYLPQMQHSQYYRYPQQYQNQQNQQMQMQQMQQIQQLNNYPYSSHNQSQQPQHHGYYGYNQQAMTANRLYQQQQQMQQMQQIQQMQQMRQKQTRRPVPFNSAYSDPIPMHSYQQHNNNYMYHQHQQTNVGRGGSGLSAQAKPFLSAAYSEPPLKQTNYVPFKQQKVSSARAQLSLSPNAYSAIQNDDPFAGLMQLNELGYTAAATSHNTISVKDVNFRKCIENNIMPTINSITFNGLLTEYYFDTTTRKHVDKQSEITNNDEVMLFYPSYCYARTKTLRFDGDENEYNGSNNDNEYYMTVKLNSNIKQNEFKRKYLNLVVLLDCSGSMEHVFDGDSNKINCGKKAIGSIIKQLNNKDRLAIIAFNDTAQIVQKMEFVNDINMNNLSENIENYITACGGTNFENGYKTSIEIYKELFNDNEYKLNSINDEYDNRIIVLTDAQLNDGMSSASKLLKLIEKYAENEPESQPVAPAIPEPKLNFPLLSDDNFPLSPRSELRILGNGEDNDGNDNTNNADNDDTKTSDLEQEHIRNRVYTTFIGIGLDFNSSLIEKITNTRGCNYYSVKTAKEFDTTINEEFENMVTPLVFNACLKLKCEADSCKIEKVYGYNDINNNDKRDNIFDNGEITKIGTLFPSKRCETISGGLKAGIQLIKLKKLTNNNDESINVGLEVTFEDRNGTKYENIQNVLFNPPKTKEDEKEEEQLDINFYDNSGIRKAILLCRYIEMIKKWIELDGGGNNKCINSNSSSSSPLAISNECKKQFVNFLKYFKSEMIECNDDGLQKEVDVINKLINL